MPRDLFAELGVERPQKRDLFAELGVERPTRKRDLFAELGVERPKAMGGSAPAGDQPVPLSNMGVSGPPTPPGIETPAALPINMDRDYRQPMVADATMTPPLPGRKVITIGQQPQRFDERSSLSQRPEPGGIAIKNVESAYWDMTPEQQKNYRLQRKYGLGVDAAPIGPEVPSPYEPYGTSSGAVVNFLRGVGLPGRGEVKGESPTISGIANFVGQGVKYAALYKGLAAVKITGAAADAAAGSISGILNSGLSDEAADEAIMAIGLGGAVRAISAAYGGVKKPVKLSEPETAQPVAEQAPRVEISAEKAVEPQAAPEIQRNRDVSAEPLQMTMYHGTRADVGNTLSPRFANNATDAGKLGRAVYFTPSKSGADWYGLGGRVIESNVRLSKPLNIRVGKDTYYADIEAVAQKLGVESKPKWDGGKQTSIDFSDEFTIKARQAGYDGAVIVEDGVIKEVASYIDQDVSTPPPPVSRETAQAGTVRPVRHTAQEVPAQTLTEGPNVPAKAPVEPLPPTKTAQGPPQPPKAEIPVSEKAGETDLIGLKRAETERLRKEIETEPANPVQTRSFRLDADEANAQNLRSKAHEIAADVIANDRPLTGPEFVGLAQRAAELKTHYTLSRRTVEELTAAGNKEAAAIEAGRAESIKAQMEQIIEASERAGTSQARAFAIRRMMTDVDTFDLVDVVRQAEKVKGTKLGEKRIAEYQQVTTKLADAEARLKQMTAELDAERSARLKAEAEKQMRREAVKAKIGQKAAGTRERIRADREGWKKQLADMGLRANVGLDPQAAYLVGRIATSYIHEGAVTLSEVVQKVMADLPDLTERDVWDALNARNPKQQAKLKSQAHQRIVQIKTEARLLSDIQSAEQGIFKAPKMRGQQLQAIKELQSKLRKLRDAAYKMGESEMQRGRLEGVLRKINEAQDQLANHYRTVKEQRPIPSEDVAVAQKTLADIRKAMRVEDRLADFQEQVRTGEFKPPKSRNIEPIDPKVERQQIEIKRLKNQIRTMQEAEAPVTFGKVAGEVFGTSRALMGTADISATLRQGFVQTISQGLRHPIRTFGIQKNSIAAMFKQYKAEQIYNAIVEHPNHYLREASGLKIHELDGVLSKRAEIFTSRFIEKIPGLGAIVRASNRHMTTFLNSIRVAAFDDFMAKYPNATRAELKAWAEFVNASTGVGDLSKLGVSAHALNKVFWAPKLAFSRVETPYLFIKNARNPRVRKAIARDLASTVGLGLSVLTLAKMGGAEVGLDPRDSDFGKIRVGDTHIDIWGGFQQPARLVARVGEAVTDRAGLTGKNLTEAQKDFDPIDAVSRFASYKLNPIISLSLTLAKGKNVVGQEMGVGEAIANSFMPLLYQDIYDAYKSESALNPALVGGLGALGVGTSTYPDSENKTRVKIRELMSQGKNADAEALKKKWNASHPDKDDQITSVKPREVK